MATEAADILADALLVDAEAHEGGRYGEIGERYDDVCAELLPLDGLSERPVRIALDFWDGWVDARNHDWLYYDGIEEHDWPRHARFVSACLRSNQMPDDPTLKKHFDRPPVAPMGVRLRGFLSRLPPNRKPQPHPMPAREPPRPARADDRRG